jgi:RND family efflux transporter MFP subunit
MNQRFICTATLLMVTAACFNSCTINKAAEQTGHPPVPVTVQHVKTKKAMYYDEYPATVVALNQVDLKPQVSGYITDIFVMDAQHVKKGMKLYAIDQQQYRAAYDQAIANLNVAKANCDKAQQDADRYNDLAKNDAVARQTLEHSIADLESAKMTVAAAEAAVHSTETNLQYSTIISPFDGAIGISQVKLGSVVNAGQTLLNTISSDDPVAVDCAVDEKQISQFHALLQSRSNKYDSVLSLILPNGMLYSSTGRLSFLDRFVDPQTGTIQVRAIFPNASRILKPGMTCNLRVRTTSSTPMILIPYEAVTEQMGEYFVFTLNVNKVTQHRVILGRSIGESVVISSGLQPEDQIVTEGIQRLHDNSLVVPTQEIKSLATAPVSGN